MTTTPSSDYHFFFIAFFATIFFGGAVLYPSYNDEKQHAAFVAAYEQSEKTIPDVFAKSEFFSDLNGKAVKFEGSKSEIVWEYPISSGYTKEGAYRSNSYRVIARSTTTKTIYEIWYEFDGKVLRNDVSAKIIPEGQLIAELSRAKRPDLIKKFNLSVIPG